MPNLPGWIPPPLMKTRILMKMRLILLHACHLWELSMVKTLNWHASCPFIIMFGSWQPAWAVLPPTSEKLRLNHGWVHWRLPFPSAILQMPCLGSCLATSPSVILARCSWVRSVPVVYGIQVSLVAELAKNPPAMQDTPVWFLSQKDPLEKG